MRADLVASRIARLATALVNEGFTKEEAMALLVSMFSGTERPVVLPASARPGPR